MIESHEVKYLCVLWLEECVMDTREVKCLCVFWLEDL